MNNIKGEDGCINIKGIIGEPSIMFKSSDPNFWENIEDGIYPLVKVFVDYNIETYSSCQGHHSKNLIYLANVRYYTNNRLHSFIQDSIKKYNDSNIVLKDCKKFQPSINTEEITFGLEPIDDISRKELNDKITDFSIFLRKQFEENYKK